MLFIVGKGKTGTELWKSDGNEGGTLPVKTSTDLTIYANIRPGYDNFDNCYLQELIKNLKTFHIQIIFGIFPT
jgi:ELWxxDGT repeat protein